MVLSEHNVDWPGTIAAVTAAITAGAGAIATAWALIARKQKDLNSAWQTVFDRQEKANGEQVTRLQKIQAQLQANQQSYFELLGENAELKSQIDFLKQELTALKNRGLGHV